jgi:hypothetical protein
MKRARGERNTAVFTSDHALRGARSLDLFAGLLADLLAPCAARGWAPWLAEGAVHARGAITERSAASVCMPRSRATRREGA